MITRGHLVGHIIDSWASVKEQAEIRCSLNLTDLPIYLEDYFCEVLNIIRNVELENRNATDPNSKGLDLADETKDEYWQITVQKTSTKINETLKKAHEEGVPEASVNVLIIGSKQGSYAAVQDELKEALGFNVNEHIWDISDLAKSIVSLPLDRLHSLYNYVKSEEGRIRIEMQVPTPEGDFPTSFTDFVDSIPQPRTCGIDRLYEHLRSCVESAYAKDEAATRDRLESDLDSLTTRLRRLPRVTREFYTYLINNIEDHESGMHGSFDVNLDSVQRNARRYSDIDGEISILSHYDFVVPPHPEDVEKYDSAMLTLYNHGEHDTFLTELIDFLREEGVNYRHAFVHLDFSSLGECEQSAD